MSTIEYYLRSSALPMLETRMLMQHVTGLSRTGLITQAHDAISATHAAQLDALVARRIMGEPMAYIIGQREFYGRAFTVTPDVLIPRPDTETLIDAILEHNHHEALRVLDLGTGSGVIAITLALERPSWQVYASDISSAALSVATHNAQQLQAAVQFTHSDWLAGFDAQKFDLIVSNPPYIEAGDIHLTQGDLRFEPQLALTDAKNGLTNYVRLVDTVPDYLNPQGQLWFEHGYNQAEAISDLMVQKGYTHVRTFRDLGQNNRVTNGIYNE